MISCPKCRSSLPDWVQKCQFCGADTGQVARPVVVNANPYVGGYEPPQWISIAYYSISGWFIFSATISILRIVLEMISDSKTHPAAGGPDQLHYISIFICAIEIMVGIGLIYKVGIVRAIVRFFCALKILLAIFGLVFVVAALAIAPLLGLLILVQHLFDVACAAFMLYLISETDSLSPY